MTNQLQGYKTDKWKVEFVSGVADINWIYVSAESKQVLESKELLSIIADLSSKDSYGRFMHKGQIYTRLGQYRRKFYFKMSKNIKLQILNNEEKLPDQIIFGDRVISTIKVLTDQVLSEKKNLKIEIVDVYDDLFISITTLKRNVNNMGEKCRLFLDVNQFIKIQNSFNIGISKNLMDTISKYEISRLQGF